MLSASVTVDKQLISSIGKGILIFAAVAPGDTEKDAEALAAKVIKMRLWDDETGGRVYDTACTDVHRELTLMICSGSIMCRISMARSYVVCSDYCLLISC